jgi:hypothetical protein
MNLQQFKQELRHTDIKYDPWGCTMEAWFECAGRMNRRGLDIPSEWNYRPGMGTDGTDKENHWYAMFGRCGNNQLRIIGNYLYRLSTILEKFGKSY